MSDSLMNTYMDSKNNSKGGDSPLRQSLHLLFYGGTEKIVGRVIGMARTIRAEGDNLLGRSIGHEDNNTEQITNR